MFKNEDELHDIIYSIGPARAQTVCKMEQTEDVKRRLFREGKGGGRGKNSAEVLSSII